MYKRKLRYKIGQWINYNYNLPMKFYESKSEKVFYNICRSVGMRPKKQVKILSYRVDFLWKDIIFEIDSEYHNVKKDKERDRLLKKEGYDVVRFNWKDLYKAEKIKVIEKKLTFLKCRYYSIRRKKLMNKVANWSLSLGIFSLGIMLFIVLAFWDGLFPKENVERKDTRIIVNNSCVEKGKCYAGSLMTTFTNCIETCKAFQKIKVACKCDVYTDEQMKILEANQ